MGVWGLAPISREAIKKRGCGGLPPPLREAPHYWEPPAGGTFYVYMCTAVPVLVRMYDLACIHMYPIGYMYIRLD